MKSSLLLQQLFEDLEQYHGDRKLGLRKDCQVLTKRSQNEGFSFLAKTLPLLGDAVFRGLEDGAFICPSNFRKKDALPLLLRGLLKGVFCESTGKVLEHINVAYLSDIRQICYMFKKAQGKASDESELDRQACKSFFAVEDEMKDLTLNETKDLRSIAWHLWQPSNQDGIQRFDPKHGPGAVAEGYKTNEKWKGILAHFLGMLSPSDSMPFFEERAFEYSSRPDTVPLAKPVAVAARLVSVPKNSVSRRTITIEPCCNMFLQQQLNSYIRHRIRSSVLCQALTLDDQRTSQRAALDGSSNLRTATIDLSAASDRMSLSLVESFFQHDQVLLQALLRARTSQVEYDGVVHQLRKYAGMGNATTFPVQSIIFTAIAVQSILDTRCKRITRRTVETALGQVVVFGDDIVIPSDSFERLSELMQLYGLKVNKGKSFVNSKFRESCGVDAYDGVNITPTYVRHQPESLECDPSAIVGLISTANQLWDRAYYRTSKCLTEFVESVLGRLPLVRSNSAVLGWTTRQDAYNFSRWNESLHRFEVKGFCVTAKRRNDPLDGYPGLLRSLVRPSPSVDPESSTHSIVRKQIALKKRWLNV